MNATQQIIQYNLPAKAGEARLPLPIDADIFMVREKGNAIALWTTVTVLVDSPGVLQRTFWIANNGDHLPSERYEGHKKKYLGTAIINDIPLHVWEIL